MRYIPPTYAEFIGSKKERLDFYLDFIRKLPNVPSFEEFEQMSEAGKIAYVRNETINYVLNEN